MASLILSGPAAASARAGQAVTFSVGVAAIPAPSYQWFRNGTPIRGATAAALKLENVQASDAARYSVTVTNGSGSATSRAAALTVR
jgi:hypothetical protein